MPGCPRAHEEPASAILRPQPKWPHRPGQPRVGDRLVHGEPDYAPQCCPLLEVLFSCKGLRLKCKRYLGVHMSIVETFKKQKLQYRIPC